MANLKKAYKEITKDDFPEEMTVSFGDQKLFYKKRTWRLEGKTGIEDRGLRYGENPNQPAALYELVNGNIILGEMKYIESGNGLVSSLDETSMVQFGKHPGKINLTDVDSALNILKHLDENPSAAVMKHNNPSGVAKGISVADAVQKAFMADRLAAMGGCVAVNRAMDKECAGFLSEKFIEVIVAPSYEEGSLDILKKSKNLRIIEIPRMDQLSKYCELCFLDMKSLIDGGIIVQRSAHTTIYKPEDFLPACVKTKKTDIECIRKPTTREYEDLIFGWNLELGVTSNSVLFVKDGVTVAIGTGEQDRVGCAEIAVGKAYTKYADKLCFEKLGLPYNELVLEIEMKKRDKSEMACIDADTKKAFGGLAGSCMISDGFFPFRDGVDVGIRQKITAIAQPGGSIRDAQSIEACNEASPPVAMVFTGTRAFKH